MPEKTIEEMRRDVNEFCVCGHNRLTHIHLNPEHMEQGVPTYCGMPTDSGECECEEYKFRNDVAAMVGRMETFYKEENANAAKVRAEAAAMSELEIWLTYQLESHTKHKLARNAIDLLNHLFRENFITNEFAAREVELFVKNSNSEFSMASSVVVDLELYRIEKRLKATEL